MAQATNPYAMLVIEDDADTRDTLRELIELSGYVVETAADGHEALAKLQSGLRPCVIVLDLELGDFSGFRFREEQLKHPEWAAIPVIVQSGTYDVKSAAEQLGAVAYFCKPLDVDRLLGLVGQHSQSA